MALTHDRRGIYKKYVIARTDGEPMSESDETGIYFAIRVDGKDPYAMKTLAAYAWALEATGDPMHENMSHAVWGLSRNQTWTGFNVLGIGLPYEVVGKTDGMALDPEAQYFVFRVDDDPCASIALLEYARNCIVVNPVLANDLEELAKTKKWTYIDVDFLKPEDIFTNEED